MDAVCTKRGKNEMDYVTHLKPDGTFSSSICVTVRVVSAISRATIVTVAISTPSGSVQPSGTGMV